MYIITAILGDYESGKYLAFPIVRLFYIFI